MIAWLRRWRGPLALGLLGVVVVVGWSCGQAHLHDQERDRVVAELDADEPDWRWREGRRTREDLPVEQDLMARVLALAPRIPDRTPLEDRGEHPVWRGSWDDPPAYAAVRAWQRRWDEPAWAALCAKARDLARYPLGRRTVPKKEEFFSREATPELKAIRKVLGILENETIVRLYDEAENETVEAQLVASLQARFHLARLSMEDNTDRGVDGGMVEHLSALYGLCKVLSRRELTEEHLAQLQGTVANLHDAAALSTFARQMRGLMHETLLRLREGSLDPLKLLPYSLRNQPMTWRERELQWFAPRFARRDHAATLRFWNRVVAACDLPVREQPAAFHALDRDAPPRPQGNEAIFVYLLTPTIRSPHAWNCSIFQLYRRLARKRASVHALVAIERYRLRHGRWPNRLDDLVPAYLPTVPLDPMDGQPLRYRVEEVGVRVYSVGDNQIDEDGKNDHPHDDEMERLWSVAVRHGARCLER